MSLHSLGDPYGPLGQLYSRHHELVVRQGVTYPTVILPSTDLQVEEMIQLRDEERTIDKTLLRLGDSHCREMIRTHEITDGPVTVMSEIRGGTIQAARSHYFAMVATCDSLRFEYQTSGPAGPLRARAHELAGSQGPIISGYGRAAAIGITVVVTYPSISGRVILLGRRRSDLALDGNAWQFAPAGMVEPVMSTDPLLRSVQQELLEELGFRISASELGKRLCPLGVAVDLLRLRPEICVRLDVREGELDISGLRLAQDEFSTARLVELSRSGIEDLWSSTRPPWSLTPPAAGAIALLERYEGFGK